MLARLFLPVQQAARDQGNVIQSAAAVSLSCHAASYIRFERMNPELDTRIVRTLAIPTSEIRL
jgi:hypothetical protein